MTHPLDLSSIERMQKQISYGKDYCKKPNDKDSNKRWG